MGGSAVYYKLPTVHASFTAMVSSVMQNSNKCMYKL